jgi:hypothetical protein
LDGYGKDGLKAKNIGKIGDGKEPTDKDVDVTKRRKVSGKLNELMTEFDKEFMETVDIG